MTTAHAAAAIHAAWNLARRCTSTTAEPITSEQALWLPGEGLFGGRALVDDDAVGQVRRHNKIVLHNERRLLRMHDEPLDHLRVEYKSHQLSVPEYICSAVLT